jgi:hypothetical protein
MAAKSAETGSDCTACKGGWVEFKVVREVPVRGPDGKGVVGYKKTHSVTNARCGVCSGTGKI